MAKLFAAECAMNVTLNMFNYLVDMDIQRIILWKE